MRLAGHVWQDTRLAGHDMPHPPPSPWRGWQDTTWLPRHTLAQNHNTCTPARSYPPLLPMLPMLPMLLTMAMPPMCPCSPRPHAFQGAGMPFTTEVRSYLPPAKGTGVQGWLPRALLRASPSTSVLCISNMSHAQYLHTQGPAHTDRYIAQKESPRVDPPIGYAVPYRYPVSLCSALLVHGIVMHPRAHHKATTLCRWASAIRRQGPTSICTQYTMVPEGTKRRIEGLEGVWRHMEVLESR